MTNTHDDTPPGDRPAKKRPKADYDVGYCKPPAAHRFKHGNNANPKGRKKGSHNRKVVIRDVLFEAVTVREGGEIRQMSALEAVIKKMLSKALAGDNKAALTIIGIAQKEGILTPEQEQVVENLSESDLAIMEDVRRRLAASALEQSPETPAQPDSAYPSDRLGRAQAVAP
jgi:Family of unknown function (DUF5681)